MTKPIDPKRPDYHAPTAALRTTRPGDVFLLSIPHYWAKGETLAEARTKLRTLSGQTQKEWRAWRVHSAHPSTYLDDMGYINHPADHPPVMLDEYDPA